MRIATIDRFGDLSSISIKSVHEPVAMPEEVVIKVRFVALTSHDLEIFRDGNGQTIQPPYTGGICIAGEVMATDTYFEDPDAGIWDEGDRVVINPIIAVNDAQCTILGVHIPGGFAEYIEVPQANLCRVPDGVSLDTAALTVASWLDSKVTTLSDIGKLEQLSNHFTQDVAELWHNSSPHNTQIIPATDLPTAFTELERGQPPVLVSW